MAWGLSLSTYGALLNATAADCPPTLVSSLRILRDARSAPLGLPAQEIRLAQQTARRIRRAVEPLNIHLSDPTNLLLSIEEVYRGLTHTTPAHVPPNPPSRWRRLIDPDSVWRDSAVAEQRNAALARANAMAEFAQRLLSWSDQLSHEQRRVLYYHLADAVVRLEAWDPALFRQDPGFDPFTWWTRTFRPDQYSDIVVRWINSRRSPGRLPALFSAETMRDLAAHNLWPVAFSNHDMRHPHYAISYPLGPSMYFRTARGHNNRRFFLMASMYEGVDTFQFIHEHRLARYMTARGMNLETAMLHIAAASEAELDRIVIEANIVSDIQAADALFSDWRPPTNALYPAEALDSALESSIDEHLRLRNDEAISPYLSSPGHIRFRGR